ncbi:MAG: hypothetical protein ACJATT_004616 [Myxococcota bacterium]|jgi:hypothetical protein
MTLMLSSRYVAIVFICSLASVSCEFLDEIGGETPPTDTPAADVSVSCGVPAGEYFNVSIGQLEISPNRPSGESWDIDGSFPDPFLEIFVWSSTLEEVTFEVDTSEAASNSTRVDLGVAPVLGLYLLEDEFLVIVVMDDDNLVNDEIGQLALSAEDLIADVNCGPVEYNDGAAVVALNLTIVDDLSR